MAGPRAFALLCALLAASLVRATLSPAAVLSLSPEVIQEKLTQELQRHNATAILQQLPLLNAMKEGSSGGIPLLGSLVNTVLKYIIWLKVTSANIPQLQVRPSTYDHELEIRIPLDMVAGLNTPLVKTIVQLHMETEVQALIRVQTAKDASRLVLSDCFNSQGSLRISMLNKLSFFVNPLADKVMSLLVPALPQMVKTQLCPVVQAAFNDVYADLLRLLTAPIPLSPGCMEFHLLSPAIEGSVVQLNLGAKLLDSKGKVTEQLGNSEEPLAVPALGDAPFRLVMRQDVANALVDALLPSEELTVLLDFVLPELARELKSGIAAISEKAASALDPTQIVKILTLNSPHLLLSEGSAQVAQLIVLEVFATNKAQRPLFTLGIEGKSEAQFYTEDGRLMVNFNDVSIDRIKLMNSSIGLFNAELLKDILTKILDSVLLPNENGKLRTGVPVMIPTALGYQQATWSLTKDALVLSAAS